MTSLCCVVLNGDLAADDDEIKEVLIASGCCTTITLRGCTKALVTVDSDSDTRPEATADILMI